MASAATSSPGLRAGTLTALRYPNFRLYFIGQLISLSGSWMQIVAQGWLVFHLTQSELWLGLVACAAGLPSLVLSPAAGVLIDRIPRRRLLIFSQSAQMLLALILASLTFAGVVQVWHIMALAFLLGMVNAIDAPSRQTIIVDLVGHENLSSGIALNSFMFSIGRIFGPAAAGIALTTVGPAWCFLLNGLSFLAVIAMLLVIDIQTRPSGNSEFAPLKQLKEGLRFTRYHPTILPLLLLAITASLLTANIVTLMPAFADTVLHSPKEAYAAITTSIGIGSALAGVSMAKLGRRFGRGWVVAAMSLWVTVVCLLVSRSTSVHLVVILMGLHGFGMILEFVTVNTLIQSQVPDHFRGRVMSLYTLAWFGISPFGALGMGLLASRIGTPDTIALYMLIGGVLSIGILLRWPGIRRLR
jgi:MFS family permease